MKTQKNINLSSSTNMYVRHRREGLYPVDWGTYQSGTDRYSRVLTRSTGLWKPGEGRKPEQPYQNTQSQLKNPWGSVKVFETATTWHRMDGTLPNFFGGLRGGMNPASYGGSVKSFPMHDFTGVNPDLLSQAEVKAYLKLDGLSPEKGFGSVDLAVAMGERRETGELLHRAAVGVLNLARAVSGFSGRGRQWQFGVSEVLKDAFGVNVHPAQLARKYARRRRRLKERTLAGEITAGVAASTLMADMWLTYRLSVTPLMSEIGNAIDMVTNEVANQDGWCFRVSARHYVDKGGHVSLDIDRFHSGKQEFFVQELHGYTVTFVAAPTKRELDRLARLGLDNPASTAWELTKLSFVLDYFVSVGDFLEAINVPKRYEFIDGSWTQRIKRSYSVKIFGPESKGWGLATLDHTKRNVYSKFPVPIPPLSLNSKDVSLAKVLTMTSLVVVKIRNLLK